MNSKKNTHNYHLRNSQEASSLALKTIWTPKNLRKKEQERKTNESTMKKRNKYNISDEMMAITNSNNSLDYYNNSAHNNATAEESAFKSFEKFKVKLHICSVQWQLSKEQPEQRISLQVL